MPVPSLRPLRAALAALLVLAAPAAWSATRYSRQIKVESGLFVGLMRDRAQKGTVAVTTLEGKPLGRLTYAGSFVELVAKGTYNLEFETDDFDLNFALVKSRDSQGAYMLNLARTAGGLQAKGNWEGSKEGRVTLHPTEGQALVEVE